jgi:hypothetical protein
MIFRDVIMNNGESLRIGKVGVVYLKVGPVSRNSPGVTKEKHEVPE